MCGNLSQYKTRFQTIFVRYVEKNTFFSFTNKLLGVPVYKTVLMMHIEYLLLCSVYIKINLLVF